MNILFIRVFFSNPIMLVTYKKKMLLQITSLKLPKKNRISTFKLYELDISFIQFKTPTRKYDFTFRYCQIYRVLMFQLSMNDI